MNQKFLRHLDQEIDALRSAGLYKTERIIASQQSAEIEISTGTRVLNFCANNYLGLADHPELIRAAKSALDRYGYGMASLEHNLEIEKIHGSYTVDHIPKGKLYYCGEDEAMQICPDIFDRAVLNRVGMVTRNDKWWNFRSLEPGTKGGDGRTWYVRYECDGVNEGYVRYQVKEEVLVIIELISVTQEAYKSLWRFCLDMDLIKVIRADHRPADEELKWIIADPRRLIEHTSDRSWVRLVDVREALARRQYSTDDSIVFGVEDTFLTWNNVNLELSSHRYETECNHTTKTPDILLGASELGAVYLGAVDFTTLALAGRVDIDLANEPLGTDKEGNGVLLKDLWPSLDEVQEVLQTALKPEIFRNLYSDFSDQNPKF